VVSSRWRDKKRQSYSLHFKISVVKEYKPNVPGFGYNALAKKHGISASMVREWQQLEEELEAASENRQMLTRTMMRLPGAGRKAAFYALEEELCGIAVARNPESEGS
jgi:transposase-like protein